MPDKVDLIGEEELMPGKKWLVYRNQRTGQLSKVPREIMHNPSTSTLMMNHLTGKTDIAAEMANPQQEFKVQGAMADMRHMAPDKNKPWIPPGHDYAPVGAGQEAQVPQSSVEALRFIRQQLMRGKSPEPGAVVPSVNTPDFNNPHGPAGGGVVY